MCCAQIFFIAQNKKQSVMIVSVFVLSAGIEPTSVAPEATVLSIERREHL